MSKYVVKKTPGDTTWFRHDRFGMFIHFGLYSLAARHEWVKCYEHIPDEKYDRYLDYFDPDLFDAKEWARAAKAAGMKYAVLTTRHHEGFCLFDSKYTDFKITNTPFGRDLIKEYVEAFRAEGLKVGFYYSLLDWHHPDYTIDRNHPLATHPDAEKLNEGRDMHRYAAYMRNQVEELLTNYGKIDLLWFDFSFDRSPSDPAWMKGKSAEDWEAEKLIALARKLQPGILINSRTGLAQDFFTPEQYQPKSWLRDKEGNLVTWEACQTFSGSWGYYRDEASWKSHNHLVRMLIETVSLGGNLIMNVGPTARGTFDDRATAALAAFGEWMKKNERSIVGCTMADPEWQAPDGCKLTESEDGKRLYLHLFSYPYRYIELPGWAGKIKYAQFLHDASEIKMHEGIPSDWSSEGMTKAENILFLEVPAVKPDVTVPVIEMFL